jgi:hypothetical protein
MSKRTSIKSPRLWIVTELYYPEETSTGYSSLGSPKVWRMIVSKVLCGQPTYSHAG